MGNTVPDVSLGDVTWQGLLQGSRNGLIGCTGSNMCTAREKKLQILRRRAGDWRLFHSIVFGNLGLQLL